MMRLKTAERGYGSRWRRARAAFLAKHPICRMCDSRGRITAAAVVDHIIPHRGDMGLFWDQANWQPLCAPCHDGAKAQLERSGALKGCDAQGRPLDPRHHWNAAPQYDEG